MNKRERREGRNFVQASALLHSGASVETKAELLARLLDSGQCTDRDMLAELMSVGWCLADDPDLSREEAEERFDAECNAVDRRDRKP